jgi:hypothetical protein
MTLADDYRPDGLPKVIGLCPDTTHAAEFYMPHGGSCPYCGNELVVYVSAKDEPPKA